MKLLKSYGKAIGTKPWVFIVVFLVITVILGFFATNFQSESSEDAFTPTSEVSQANQRIREDYGATGAQISVLLESDFNILSKDAIIAQLALENEIRSSGVEEIILTTPENPDGISSPSEVIIQSIFYVKALENAPQEQNGNDITDYPPTSGFGNTGFNGNNTTDTPGSTTIDCFEAEKIVRAFISKLFNLTFDEKITIIEGGFINFSLPCVPYPVSIEFDEYSPESLPEYTSAAPMAIALEFLLSSEYKTGDTHAEKALMSISIRENISSEQQLEAEMELDKITVEFTTDYPDLKFIAIGNELISEKINEALGSSMAVLGSLALIMVILILLLIYRNGIEIIISVIALFMAIIWTFGVGGLFGFSFSPNITTVPVLIFGLGIDYGIHMTLRYREELRKGKSVVKALSTAEGTVGVAIGLATITTLLGFLSNALADSAAVRQFGILLAAGILSAFIIMISFPTAVKVLIDGRKERLGKPVIKRKKAGDSAIWGWARKRAVALGLTKKERVPPSGMTGLNRGLSHGASLAQHPAIVIAVVLVISGVGVYGGLQLEPKFDFRDFLPDGLEVTDAAKSIVDNFDFSKEEAYVLVEGSVTDPEVFKTISLVQDRARKRGSVVGSEPIYSPVELGKSLSDPTSPQYNESFSLLWHLNVDKNFDEIPDLNLSIQNVTRVYDGLFFYAEDEASRVLKREPSGNYSSLLIRIPVNSRGGLKVGENEKDVLYAAAPMEKLEGGKDIVVTATGGPLIQQEILDSINKNQIQSVLFTFIISLLILSIIFFISRRTLSLGLITLLPLVFVIAWTAGAMYYLGIPLNVVTVTISAITVGLGIDYGVHISSRFVEELDRTKDGLCALSVAVSHTGSALFGSAATTIIGFAIISLAIIPPLKQFGQVTAISITFSFIAAVFVLPTLLLLWVRGNHWYRRKFKGEDIPEMTGECE